MRLPHGPAWWTGLLGCWGGFAGSTASLLAGSGRLIDPSRPRSCLAGRKRQPRVMAAAQRVCQSLVELEQLEHTDTAAVTGLVAARTTRAMKKPCVGSGGFIAPGLQPRPFVLMLVL